MVLKKSGTGGRPTMGEPPTYRTSSRSATAKLTSRLRAEGRGYVVVNRRGRELDSWKATGINPTQKGGGMSLGSVRTPGAAPTAPGEASAPARGSPGTGTTRFGPLRNVFNLDVYNTRNTDNAGNYIDRFYDPVMGRWIYEPAGMSMEMWEPISTMVALNRDPDRWRQEFRDFAGNYPGITAAGGLLAAGAAAASAGALARNASATGEFAQRVRRAARSAPAGFNTRPRGGGGRLPAIRNAIPFFN